MILMRHRGRKSAIMGLGNLLLLTQVTSYLLTFLFCFFIFIPLTVNLNEFNGHCLLHADGGWVEAPKNGSGGQGRVLEVKSWGNSGNCNYGIFVGIVSLPLSLFYLIWMSSYLFKGTEPSWAAAFITLVTTVVTTLMLFIGGIVVTSGFHAWCALLEKGHLECSMAEFINFAEEKDINTSNFYDEMGMAQFGLWASWVVWILLIVQAGYQLYLFHTQENFFVSLHRERQRLLQKTQGYQQAPYSV